MNDTIRIAIFGGRRGMAYYAPITARQGFSVCAVCEQDESAIPDIQKEISEETKICRTFDELIACRPDAVILANYFHEHAKYAIRAMEAGIDVISETTAAPTPAACLALIETAERTGRKYMLAANCVTMVGPEELGKVYRNGELGEIYYAEAEYLHALDYTIPSVRNSLAPTDKHWRRFLPTTYYNMHSLGVLMALTGLSPRRVTAMEINTEKSAAQQLEGSNKSVGGFALYEMDNGAIFRSTGCCRFGPNGKWYRLSCEKGTVETTRLDQDRILLRKIGEEAVEYAPEHQYTDEEKKTGHGGADARVCAVICDYLQGKGAPTMDVYQAAELSLAGIYGLYSILESRTIDIPDPRDKAAREVLRGDDRSPFPDENGRVTLPCFREK